MASLDIELRELREEYNYQMQAAEERRISEAQEAELRRQTEQQESEAAHKAQLESLEKRLTTLMKETLAKRFVESQKQKRMELEAKENAHLLQMAQSGQNLEAMTQKAELDLKRAEARRLSELAAKEEHCKMQVQVMEDKLAATEAANAAEMERVLEEHRDATEAAEAQSQSQLAHAWAKRASDLEAMEDEWSEKLQVVKDAWKTQVQNLEEAFQAERETVAAERKAEKEAMEAEFKAQTAGGLTKDQMIALKDEHAVELKKADVLRVKELAEVEEDFNVQFEEAEKHWEGERQSIEDTHKAELDQANAKITALHEEAEAAGLKHVEDTIAQQQKINGMRGEEKKIRDDLKDKLDKKYQQLESKTSFEIAQLQASHLKATEEAKASKDRLLEEAEARRLADVSDALENAAKQAAEAGAAWVAEKAAEGEKEKKRQAAREAMEAKHRSELERKEKELRDLREATEVARQAAFDEAEQRKNDALEAAEQMRLADLEAADQRRRDELGTIGQRSVEALAESVEAFAKEIEKNDLKHSESMVGLVERWLIVKIRAARKAEREQYVKNLGNCLAGTIS